MRSIFTTATAAAALLVGFGLAAGPAWADQYADEVESFALPNEDCLVSGGTCDVSGDNNDKGEDALGAPDFVSGDNTTFTALGFDTDTEEGGVLVLNFTDNVCLDGAGDDVEVTEAGARERYNVEVGMQGDPLTFIGEFSGTDSADAGGTFNQISMEATHTRGGNNDGADIDAVECLYTLDPVDISKDFAANPLDTLENDGTGFDDQIFAGVDDQQFKAFTITITNNTGIDDAFDDLIFFDVAPAEWDASPESEAADDDGDGGGDGIAVISGNCTASIDEHQSSGGGNGNKLKPEFITIDAGDLDSGESCAVKVWVETDGDHPGRGNSPDFTPTSCPVTLNDGVRGMDNSGNILLEDDDSLVFVEEPEGDEGECLPAS